MNGELCTDRCARRGYSYFWCHKVKLDDDDDNEDDHDIDNHDDDHHDVYDAGDQHPWPMVGPLLSASQRHPVRGILRK